MKVHFSADPVGDKHLYRAICSTIQSLGHTVVTYHALEQTKEGMEQETPQQFRQFHRNMKQWMRQADVVMFDATVPTLSLGYEVGISTLILKKPTVILYNEELGLTWTVGHGFKALDASESLLLTPYKPQDVSHAIETSLSLIALRPQPRFNFIITDEIERYLDWIARHWAQDKSVYLRRLIKMDMESNVGYQNYLRSFDTEDNA